jgi:hypothetical protein
MLIQNQIAVTLFLNKIIIMICFISTIRSQVKEDEAFF